ncbi:heterokaryon incompatibility domain-containing protein [Trichoderma sp. SZMC 28013]
MSANQSRRRIDLDQSPENSTKPKIDNILPYQGRELETNSLRLVEIQPAAHESDPVVCTLNGVSFGDRPKFEALSYMWGTEKADDAITLNGHPFEVGKNLLDALLFLRGSIMSKKTCQLFWIDAICINQNDVEERNRQVSIMDQIYFRAVTVVVWLGSKYAEIQNEIIGELRLEESGMPGKGSSQSVNSAQQKMVRHLRTDPYWDRLWILQEIGRARQLRVCFGNETFSWEGFMSFVALHNSDGTTGPLKLNRLLREEKYNDSHTLKRLLEEHREAKCSKPRDKVYGLVGLASDAGEFPIDYKKSLYEVWKDTMVFMNKRNLFQDESQILPTGALVKSLLMANHSDPLSQLSKEHEDQVDSTQLINDSQSPLGFHLKASLLGCIVCVGPSASDIISKLDEATRWRIATQQLFPGDELGLAHQEYDRLLHALLELDESKIEAACFNRPSPVIWRDLEPRNRPTNILNYIRWALHETKTTTLQRPQLLQGVTDRLAPVQPRLYLAKQPGGCTLRKMGVASGLVQPNDIVVSIRSSRRALLVRVVEVEEHSENTCTKLRMFGTALTTEDVCGATPKSKGEYEQRWKSVDERTTEVQIDAGTLFMLLD